MLNDELTLLEKGRLSKDKMRELILKTYPECNFAFIPKKEGDAVSGSTYTLLDNSENIIINNIPIDASGGIVWPDCGVNIQSIINRFGDQSDDIIYIYYDLSDKELDPNAGYQTDNYKWKLEDSILYRHKTSDTVTLYHQFSSSDNGYGVLSSLPGLSVLKYPEIKDSLFVGCVCMRLSMTVTFEPIPNIPDIDVPL